MLRLLNEFSFLSTFSHRSSYGNAAVSVIDTHVNRLRVIPFRLIKHVPLSHSNMSVWTFRISPSKGEILNFYSHEMNLTPNSRSLKAIRKRNLAIVGSKSSRFGVGKKCFSNTLMSDYKHFNRRWFENNWIFVQQARKFESIWAAAREVRWNVNFRSKREWVLRPRLQDFLMSVCREHEAKLIGTKNCIKWSFISQRFANENCNKVGVLKSRLD